MPARDGPRRNPPPAPLRATAKDEVAMISSSIGLGFRFFNALEEKRYPCLAGGPLFQIERKGE
jgi:hypothetical protein